MIYGIGTDIVDVRRIQAAVDRFGDRFAKRVLGSTELEAYDALAASQQSYFLAKRFSAKEATAKALGRKLNNGLTFKDITVTHDAHGKPMLLLTGVALEVATSVGIADSFISLSDEKNYAIAYVVLTTS